MPKAARFKVAAIEDLLRQLEYAPPETRQRHMDAAETLIGDLDPTQNYPLDFIIFRITGYRPDTRDEPVTLVGQALRPDLVTLVQVLSDGLTLTADHEGRNAITLEQVAARLNVSTKSVQRYRKLGLVSHHVSFADGARKLAFFEDAVDRFAQGQQSRLAKAGTFTRVNGEAETVIINEARQLRNAEHLTLNEAALRLASTHARAHETIRQMLRRHDRKAREPIFTDRGPMTPRETRLAYRAWQRGIDPADIARRLRKSKPTIHRAINRRRSDLLQGVAPDHVALPTFYLPDAASVILASPMVTRDLDPGEWRDAKLLIERARLAEPVDEDAEAALLAAYNLLKHRAAEAIGALGAWPGSEALDEIETDLRWASRLKAKLAWLAFPSAIRSIGQNLPRPLLELPSDQIAALIIRAIGVISDVIESIDPGRGQRLERLTSFTTDRELARIQPSSTGRQSAVRKIKAAAKHSGAAIPLGDAMRRLCRWNEWLGLRSDLQVHVASLEEPMREVITRRFGLDGTRPQTSEMIAAATALTPIRVVRVEHRGIRELRRLARSAITP